MPRSSAPVDARLPAAFPDAGPRAEAPLPVRHSVDAQALADVALGDYAVIGDADLTSDRPLQQDGRPALVQPSAHTDADSMEARHGDGDTPPSDQGHPGTDREPESADTPPAEGAGGSGRPPVPPVPPSGPGDTPREGDPDEGDGEDMGKPPVGDEASPGPADRPMVAAVSPKIVAIFGTPSAADGGLPERLDDEYVHYAAAINRPPLVVQLEGRSGRRGGQSAEEEAQPLHPDARRLVVARAEHLIRRPDAAPPDFDETKLLRTQQIIDGLARGESARAVAREMDLSHFTVSGVLRAMYGVLSTRNHADTMFSVQSFGYSPNVPLAEDLDPEHPPELAPNMRTHLYLGSVGFTEQEAADLTEHSINLVRHARQRAARQLGAKFLPHAVANAYRVGIYEPIPLDDETR